MPKKKQPAEFSAYVVTHSTVDAMPVHGVLVDKGALLVRDWNVMDFNTGVETGAVGHRLSRLCRECRLEHNIVGILGHDGECGTEDVKSEGRQVLADAKKRVLAEVTA